MNAPFFTLCYDAFVVAFCFVVGEYVIKRYYKKRHHGPHWN